MSISEKLDEALGDRSYVTEVITAISQIPELRRITASNILNGAVGLFEASDGKQYEIVIRPADLGKYKNLLTNSEAEEE